MTKSQKNPTTIRPLDSSRAIPDIVPDAENWRTFAIRMELVVGCYFIEEPDQGTSTENHRSNNNPSLNV